jgi:Mrp family chromosome partitioning ATPase
MTGERGRRFRRGSDVGDVSDNGGPQPDSSRHGDAHDARSDDARDPGDDATMSSGDLDRLPVKHGSGRNGRRAPTMLAYEDIPVEIAEALRGIVNRSELRAGDPLPQAIAVTSTVRGEGATTLSKSLAALIANEMGRFVCWIDCSWLSSDSGHEQGGRPNLIDIFADDSRMESAFESTPGQPSLVSLSPGPVPASQRNLIARSPEFDHMVGLLKDEFDHLVFDLPPILSHANAIGLLRQVDAGILVVRHRSTSVTNVERALEAMQPTPNLAVVLNRYRSSIPKRIRRLLGG